ncbi:MAG: hypothetical protein ACLR4Z_13845 [Butyricicoccaceae bacterium]
MVDRPLERHRHWPHFAARRESRRKLGNVWAMPAGGIAARHRHRASGTADKVTSLLRWTVALKISGSGKVGAAQAHANNVSVSTTGTKALAVAGVFGVCRQQGG